MPRRASKPESDSAPVPVPGMRAVRGLSFLNRVLAVVALGGAVFVSTAVWLKPRAEKLRDSERELERLRAHVEERKREEARLQRQLVWLEKDPDYLAMILRDRFDLMADGETIYRIEPARTPPPTVPRRP